jgi:CTP:phosphocholine cytidylyltransferase-like protein
MLTKEQFDYLSFLADKDRGVNPKQTSTSPEVLAQLQTMGAISNEQITPKGYELLQPYKVKRVLIMAAGFGSRMAPLTLTTPKPLVKVNGKRMIDTGIDAVLKAGIPEIYVIRGYKAEMFDELLEKYPMVKFVENPFYAEGNAILSIACAGALIKNCYTMEADLIISNPDIIKPYQYKSTYLGIPVEQTEDWCIEVKDDVIYRIGKGGKNCYQTVGIAYWSEEDGTKLYRHIKEVISKPEGRNYFVGQVALTVYKDDYKVGVRAVAHEDIVEIDTLDELKQIDKSYA